MPLMQGKSQGAFKHNLKAEMAAGKPKAQSLAIAYSVKRKAQRKADGGKIYPTPKDPHYAEGGSVDNYDMKKAQALHDREGRVTQEDIKRMSDEAASQVMKGRGENVFENNAYASGGETHPMVIAIMKKRHKPIMPAHYDEGGMVDVASDANLKENYGKNLQKMAHEGKGQGHTITFPGMEDMDHYAEGGEMGDMDEGFLADDMMEPDWEEDHELDGSREDRKKMLSGIMEKIRARHYGK